MNGFSMSLTFLLTLSLIAAGLIILHVAKKENALLLKMAGWILILGSVAMLAVTGLQCFKYSTSGFSAACPYHTQKMNRGWKRGDKIWKNDRHNNLDAQPAVDEPVDPALPESEPTDEK